MSQRARVETVGETEIAVCIKCVRGDDRPLRDGQREIRRGQHEIIPAGNAVAAAEAEIVSAGFYRRNKLWRRRRADERETEQLRLFGIQIYAERIRFSPRNPLTSGGVCLKLFSFKKINYGVRHAQRTIKRNDGGKRAVAGILFCCANRHCRIAPKVSLNPAKAHV